MLNHDNALGLVDAEHAGYLSASSRCSSTSDVDTRESVAGTSASSASISTPRSAPASASHSPLPQYSLSARRGQRPYVPLIRMPSDLNNASSPTQLHLPMIKLEPRQQQQQQFAALLTPTPLPSVADPHWSY